MKTNTYKFLIIGNTILSLCCVPMAYYAFFILQDFILYLGYFAGFLGCGICAHLLIKIREKNDTK